MMVLHVLLFDHYADALRDELVKLVAQAVDSILHVGLAGQGRSEVLTRADAADQPRLAAIFGTRRGNQLLNAPYDPRDHSIHGIQVRLHLAHRRLAMGAGEIASCELWLAQAGAAVERAEERHLQVALALLVGM